MGEVLALEIKKSALGPFTSEDAVSLYQNARSRAGYLSIIGRGHESAFCLMLASRFMPDEIHIFPLIGCGIDEFLKEVSLKVPFLYFICAPIKIYVSSMLTDYENAKIKRLYKSISSFQKEIVYVENEFETYRNLTNLYKTTKTLA